MAVAVAPELGRKRGVQVEVSSKSICRTQKLKYPQRGHLLNTNTNRQGFELNKDKTDQSDCQDERSILKLE